MVENSSGNKPKQREVLPVIDFFRRWRQYDGFDCGILAFNQGAAVGHLVGAYRSSLTGSSESFAETAIFVGIPLVFSIVWARTMRHNAIQISQRRR